MSLQVMDVSENEDRGKIKGRTQEVTREKSILDFFERPPEKEVLVKQKSLLQFFVKANITTSKSQISTNSIECDKEQLSQEKNDKHGQNESSCDRKIGTQEIDTDSRPSEFADVGSKLDEPVIVNGESSNCSLTCLENDVKDEGVERIKTTKNDLIRNTNGCVESGTTVKQREDGVYKDSDFKITLAKDEVHTISAEDKESCGLLISDENVVCSAQKRSNLKVKDMLNLLREVKVSEKKEKRKKHKHKLHKQKTMDTCEINEESNDGIVCKDAEKDCKEYGNENEKKVFCQGNELCKNDNFSGLEQKNDVEKGKEATQINRACKLFSNDENPREMSYSEFLDRLNKKEKIIEVDKLGETKDLNTMESDVKLVKEESDCLITKYFNCTSTPGRGKANGNIKAETPVQSKGSTTCNSEQNKVNSERKLVTENFFQSKIDIPSKTTSQATLCFGSDGFKIARQRSIVETTTDQKVKSATGTKDKKQISDIDTKNQDLNTSESAFETPVKRKNIKRKFGQNGDRQDGDRQDEFETSELTDNPESEGCRRSQRKKYKVTVFQMDEERRTPIKIKLRRCAKSSSSGNEFEKSSEGKPSKTLQTKVKAKQTTAQALLEKAKNRIHKTKLRTKSEKETLQLNENGKKTVNSIKTKQKLNDTIKKSKKKKKEAVQKGEPANARRSSRLEGKVKVSMEEVSIDNIVISSDEEAAEISKRVKKQKKKAETGNGVQPSKSTPVKSSKAKSPVKKPNAKLAPMFLMGKKKVAASPAPPALDQEQARQRQLFLMSGVPDELKKQTTIRQANTTISSYPPIPTVNHVQQLLEDKSCESDIRRLNVWKWGNLESSDLQSPIIPISKFSSTADIPREEEKGAVGNWKFEKARILEDNIADRCLAEIIASNPTYPAKELFTAFREYKLCSKNEQIKADTVELKTDMKGILSDELIKSEAEQKKAGKSLKLSRKEDRERGDEAKTTVPESAQSCSSLLWTDKYYPTKASEILGNGGGLKKLKDWLLEWKQVLDREAKKARKLLLKKNKGKLATSKGPVRDDDSDFDSDFDIDSDDSEDDMSLCNTTLLVGPHGCGKTSSVYALAQELGFKVHEVNASSLRSGRLILSQLQEATQSHQVSSQGCHTPSKKKGVIEKVSDDKGQPKSKMALSFTNLSSKQNLNKDKGKADSSLKKKRQKGDKGGEKLQKETRPSSIKNKQMMNLISEDSSSQSLTHNINLSRTTLILFEEVDVAFEEDKGFLAAVQTFMSTTKIPIVLTSNKKNFSPSFDGRFEVINLRRPSVQAVTSHLQTMALVENIRTDFAKLSELVNLYDRDVRRCILSLQLLVESGGNIDQNYSVLMDSPTNDKTSDKMSDINADKAIEPQNGNEGKLDDDDLDDFVVLKGRQTKRRRILDDQDSNSGDHHSFTPVHQASIAGVQDATRYPVVYGFGLKCFLPRLLQCESSSTIEHIKENLMAKSRSKVEDMITICRTFRSITGIDMFYNNIHLLLPLSFNVCDSIKQSSQGQRRLDRKTKKRKRIQSDLYDSEGSGSEDVVTNRNDELDCTVKEDIGEETVSKTNSSCFMKSMSAFASFYDTLSSLDVIRTSSDIESHDSVCTKGDMKVQTQLPAGLDDELCICTNRSTFESETLNDLQSAIETRAFCQLSNHLECVRDELEKSVDMNSDQWTKFTLPVTTGMDQFQVKDKPSTSLELQRAITDIRDNLPYTVNKNHRCVGVDYIPTLREICRCESARLSANTKRRFQHYLDNITLPLKDKTMTILTTTFT